MVEQAAGEVVLRVEPLGVCWGLKGDIRDVEPPREAEQASIRRLDKFHVLVRPFYDRVSLRGLLKRAALPAATSGAGYSTVVPCSFVVLGASDNRVECVVNHRHLAHE